MPFRSSLIPASVIMESIAGRHGLREDLTGPLFGRFFLSLES
jgi:hypothetical protein